jgi:DNA-binding transcriptional LysR family regulator
VETDRLAHFCAIVESGSLTGAADLLGVSHSGLSKSMTQLQNELGVRLLVPRGRGLEVTEQGHDVYRKSKEILAHLNGLRVRRDRGSDEPRIGMDGPLAHAAAGPLANAFSSGVELGHFEAGDLETRVREGRLDFAFTIVPFPHADIEHLAIGNAEFASYAREGAFDGLAAEKVPYVVPSTDLRDNPLSLKAKDGWNQKLERFTPYRASNLAVALGLVNHGLAAIYIPSFLATALNESPSGAVSLAELDVGKSRRNAERSTHQVFLVKRRTEEETRAMRRASGVVRTTLSGQGQASGTSAAPTAASGAERSMSVVKPSSPTRR